MEQRDVEKAQEISERLASEPSARRTSSAVDYFRGLAGAVIGGVLGYFAFGWLLNHGFYAIIIPGTLLGLGCGALMKRQSIPMGVVCGVAGLILGVIADWKHSVYSFDVSAYMRALPKYPVQILLIGLGAVFAAWFGRGRDTAYRQ